MHASKHSHTFHVVPFAGGARTIAPGEIVDLEQVIGTDVEGAPLTLRQGLTAEQLEKFQDVGDPTSKKSPRQRSEE